MEKINIMKGVLAATMLISPMVLAEDQKYPAADFKPEVIYQDKDYINKKAAEHTEQYTAEPEQKYPAANFEPKVIYSDGNYKHAEPLSSSANTKPVQLAEAPRVGAEGAGRPLESKEESFDVLALMAMLALVVAGMILFKGKFKVCPKCAPKTAENSAEGKQQLTGVARYINKISGTGVSRYIEKQVKTSQAVTGVARYIAKQVSSPTSSEAKTGVEKYMRNRG